MRRGDFFQGLLWLLLGLFLLSGAWAASAQERLAGQVIRLHVLAASDRPEDQARKLRVRDAVLSRTEVFLREAESRAEAERILRERLPDLRDAAADLLTREGCADGVRLELAETDFPTRVYDGGDVGTGADGGVSVRTGAGVSAGNGREQDGFALPAGRYLALRVVIGPGAGRNWWCVVFPPLCGGGTERRAPEEETPSAQGGEEPPKRTPEAERAKPEAPPSELPISESTEAGTGGTPEQEAAVPETPVSTVPAVPAVPVPAAPPVVETPAAPAVSAVRGLPAAARRYEVRFRIVELWGRFRAALP